MKTNRWIQVLSLLCVAATFVLIFIGGMVTSKGAGMAVPDWPLSFGSLNPEGWWHMEPVRLEHGHRLFASLVGFLTAILAACVWRSVWALPAAAVVSFLSVKIGAFCGLEKITLMHLAIWPPALAFVIVLLLSAKKARIASNASNALSRWLSVVAFVGVCLQATLGGLRVTEVSLFLAGVHGCVGQAFLCILIALSISLSRWWNEADLRFRGEGLAVMRRIAWVFVISLFLQLILGAAVRHSGSGLAIQDFPLSKGQWVPDLKYFSEKIHYAHRVGALVVTLVATTLVGLVMWRGRRDRVLSLQAQLLVALIAFQIALGAHIIWLMRPPLTTTLHVLNGAFILGLSVAMAMRLSRYQKLEVSSSRPLVGVPA